MWMAGMLYLALRDKRTGLFRDSREIVVVCLRPRAKRRVVFSSNFQLSILRGKGACGEENKTVRYVGPS